MKVWSEFTTTSTSGKFILSGFREHSEIRISGFPGNLKNPDFWMFGKPGARCLSLLSAETAAQVRPLKHKVRTQTLSATRPQRDIRC